MASSPFTIPIVLSGSAQVAPNSDAVISGATLANPLAVPLELLEVRFRCLPVATSIADNNIVTGLGVGLKMDIGKISIVDAYTPIGVFASARESADGAQYLGDQTLAAVAIGGTPAASNPIPAGYPTVYSWRMKYPIFLPVETVPSIVLRPLGQNTFPVRIDLAYICRTWDMSKPFPRTTKVPWACSFKPKGTDFVSGAPAYNDVSSSLDIANPFGSKLEVARFGGRISRPVTAVAAAPGAGIGEEHVNYRHNMASITIRSSRGFNITRQATSFGGIFPYSWRVWDLAEPWYMNPKEFYSVGLSVAAFNEDPSVANGPYQVQFGIGMVGYRTVPVSAFGEG